MCCGQHAAPPGARSRASAGSRAAAAPAGRRRRDGVDGAPRPRRWCGCEDPGAVRPRIVSRASNSSGRRRWWPCRPGRACAASPSASTAAIASIDLGAPPPGGPRCSSIIAADQIGADRVGDARPAMSGAEPCTGSNIDGNSPLRVDVGRRRDADAAGDGGRQVGQDVAEQVGADDHVEPGRVEHKLARQRVDVHRVPVPRPGARPRARRTISSQNGMVCMIPLDLVAEVSRPPRLRAPGRTRSRTIRVDAARG